MMHLLKPTERATREKANVDHKLINDLALEVHQPQLTSHSDGGPCQWESLWRTEGPGAIRKLSVLSASFCYEPKIALKKENLFKKKQNYDFNNLLFSRKTNPLTQKQNSFILFLSK